MFASCWSWSSWACAFSADDGRAAGRVELLLDVRLLVARHPQLGPERGHDARRLAADLRLRRGELGGGARASRGSPGRDATKARPCAGTRCATWLRSCEIVGEFSTEASASDEPCLPRPRHARSLLRAANVRGSRGPPPSSAPRPAAARRCRRARRPCRSCCAGRASAARSRRGRRAPRTTRAVSEALAPALALPRYLARAAT